MSNIFYWVKKKTCLGCFRIEEIRNKDNKTGLKEGGVIEMSTTVLSIYVMHALFRFEYLRLLLMNTLQTRNPHLN